jgi:hypothetical protein
MDNVFDFRNELVAEYRDFTRSFSKIAATDIRQKVDSEYADGRYWPEPLIQINPNYRRSATVQQLAAKGDLHAACAELFKARKPEGTRDELRYILDPSDVMGDDYPSETFRVLKNGEMREFGEYRTQRLVLAAWDALHAREAL